MAKQRELHKEAFHLVRAVIANQWWICFGRGPVNTWSIVSKFPTYAEGLAQWHVLFPKKPK